MRRPTALPDEREIVRAAGRGDRGAFERLYRAYAPVLYRDVLAPMLGDRDDAQDCLRETFVAAWRALPEYRWSGASIYPWLKVLAKNKARDLMRAAGRRQRLRGSFADHLAAMTEPEPGAAEEADRELLRARIEAVLQGMHPRYAQVLRLRLLEDRERQHCADLLGVKVGTLDVLLFRACRAFAKAWAAAPPEARR